MAASAAAAAPAEGKRRRQTPEATVAWSPEEDAELRAVVEQQGVGSWQRKAEAFSTVRSANAMRHRWEIVSSKAGSDAGFWTPEEDEELRAVVQREGLGNWRQKAEAFSTSRSGDSLRQRWGLIKDAEPGRVALIQPWTTDELESLGKLVKKEGAGDWDTKAELLGTGRTAKALERKWMKIVVAQRKANERSEGQGMEQELQEEPSPLSSPAGAEPWSPEEDEELRTVVEREGPGKWRQKAEAFSTTRSEGALRRRWDVV